MITIQAVSISEHKGTVKVPVSQIVINELGIVGDAHAGAWHRQISMLGQESIERFETSLGRKIEQGEFAENITTRGMELFHCMPFDRFVCNDVVLEVTQIGKKCHGDNCAIFQQVGSCVMPKEGIFCKVVSGGTLSPNQQLSYQPYCFKAKVICMSDRASRGEYADRSGTIIQNRLNTFWKNMHRTGIIEYVCLPDDAHLLQRELELAVSHSFDYVFTTGGTGIAPRDITPDVVKKMLDKELTGIMEYIRVTYGKTNPQALLSRSIAGTCNNTLIFTLPGSVNGVQEYMTEIEKILEHAFFMLKGLDVH